MMDFEHFMCDNGFAPPPPIDDGKIHRFRGPDEKSGGKSAWYWYIGTVGKVGDWRVSDTAILTWYDKDRIIDRARRTGVSRHKEAVERYAATAGLQAKAAGDALGMWTAAWEGTHPYLEAKNILGIGTRVLKNRLLIPMFNSKRELVNLQRIYPDGFKMFLSGGEVKGMWHQIAGCAPLYVCEGYATGATIAACTHSTVVCALTASNLMAVAIAFRHSKPIIAADNDYRTIIKGQYSNPGLKAGMRVSEELGLRMVWPVFNSPDALFETCTDFNDLRRLTSDAEVRKQLRTTVRF